MDILAIIPARGESKSIPHKNIALLVGKPLLAYTIHAALKSASVTRTIVSTDDAAIAKVAGQYGAEIPFIRPSKLSQDRTPALPVILHALSFLQKKESYLPEIVVFLQPTSPIRTYKHVDEAVKLLKRTRADSVVSVAPVPHQYNPVSVLKLSKNGLLKPFLKGPQLLRRQDKPKVWARNGPAVIAVWRSTLIKKKSLYGDAVAPLMMKPEESLDIDTPFDLCEAEFLLRRKTQTL